MIHSVRGELLGKGLGFVVVEVGGIGLKVAVTDATLQSLGEAGSAVALFTRLIVKEDALDLYGFRTNEERTFFEMLISVSGVGPRSALAILTVGALADLTAAIAEGRPDLLTQAGGIGRKTAERIIVELRSKVSAVATEGIVATMDSDTDILEALVGLGYRRDQAKAALAKIDRGLGNVEARLKAALQLLSKKAA